MSARRPSDLPAPLRQDTDQAGAAETAMDLESPLGELARDDVAGAPLLEAQFGMGVDVAPDRLDLGAELHDAVDELHDGAAKRRTATVPLRRPASCGAARCSAAAVQLRAAMTPQARRGPELPVGCVL